MGIELTTIVDIITKIKNTSVVDRLFSWKSFEKLANEALNKVEDLKSIELAAIKPVKPSLPDIATPLPITTKLAALEDFFRVQVDGYILGDLSKMMAIQPDSKGNAGCTIPPAMTMIASMEMFGTYLAKDPEEVKGTEYLLQFIIDFMPSISERDRRSIVYNFRHKLMHVFFAKMDSNNQCGLTKWPRNSDLIDRSQSPYKILNVPKLYESYLHAVELLRVRIFTDKNEHIINTFYNNFPRVVAAPTIFSGPATSSFSTGTSSSSTTKETTLGL